MIDYLYLILKFIIAGGIIVGITLLVQHVDPKYGGILAAAPITTTIAFIFTSFESGDRITRSLVLGASYFAIPSLIFLICLYILMGKFSFIPSLMGAYLVWFVVVVLVHEMIEMGVI